MAELCFMDISHNGRTLPLKEGVRTPTVKIEWLMKEVSKKEMEEKRKWYGGIGI